MPDKVEKAGCRYAEGSYGFDLSRFTNSGLVGLGQIIPEALG